VTDGIIIQLAPLEAVHLRNLIDEFLALLAEDDEHDDAVGRLTPTPYPDDADAAREYRDSTRADLLQRRERDAGRMNAALDSLSADVDPSSPTAVTAQPLRIPMADVDSWMRTLAAMRLVVANRLAIDSDDDHDPADPRFHVYDWLGYRLDELIRLADEYDAMAS